MTPERWVRVREIFAAALAEPPDRRSAFLGDACAGDPELQAEAQALLASHREAGSFIEHAAHFEATEVGGAPDADPRSPRLDVPSAATGSSAASAKAAWASCTRRSRSTRAAASRSR